MMFLVYTIEFANGYHEWWLYPEDVDIDATTREVEALIQRRNAIPDALQIVKTSRACGMVYQRTEPCRLGEVRSV
jgi:hypothetical protein